MNAEPPNLLINEPQLILGAEVRAPRTGARFFVHRPHMACREGAESAAALRTLYPRRRLERTHLVSQLGVHSNHDLLSLHVPGHCGGPLIGERVLMRPPLPEVPFSVIEEGHAGVRS